MTDSPGFIENAMTGDNVEGSEQEANVSPYSHWQRICAAGIATVSAGCTAWLQLAAAAVVFNSNDVGMSPAEKEGMRRSMLTQLFERDRSCQGLIRMSPDAFKMLCEKLRGTRRLSNYIHTSTEEQVATFLFIIGQKFTNRAISFFMCRSEDTISRYFHNVLHALISLGVELIKQPSENYQSDFIYQNKMFYPYFKDCLGSLDGTHVRVKVSKLDAAMYRRGKDGPTQNVLACCTFDLRFTYVLAGWEGSVSDSRVLKSALSREDPLRIPSGKYYLSDAGFGLSSKILVPYGRTRYHLKEYALRGPQNAHELFNFRHASLRNTIERCFGILKKRFPIISTGAECQYSCGTMSTVILACCALHNFLLEYEDDDLLTEDGGSQTSGSEAEIDQEHEISTSEEAGVEYDQGKTLRDEIAMEMWEQYHRESNVLSSSSLV